MSRLALLIPALLLAGVTTPSTSEAGKRKKSDTRRLTKSTRPNMPRGFVWPPNKTMAAMGDECAKAVADQQIAVSPSKKAGRVVTPLKLDDNTINGITYTPVYSKNQVFDCQLVLALAAFAPTLTELGIREVKFGSAFRWSKVRVGGRTKNALSRHALGIALDIVSFVDTDGNEAIVAKHYRRGNALLRAFEKAVNESGKFRILLTPRNDPKSHHDHFHLEANPDYSAPASENDERPES
jgi:hypothetical protein